MEQDERSVTEEPRVEEQPKAVPTPIQGTLKNVQLPPASVQRLVVKNALAEKADADLREAVAMIMEARELRGFFQDFNPQTGVLTYLEPDDVPVNRAARRRAVKAK